MVAALCDRGWRKVRFFLDRPLLILCYLSELSSQRSQFLNFNPLHPKREKKKKKRKSSKQNYLHVAQSDNEEDRSLYKVTEKITFPCNVNTISNRQVMGIKKNIS